jgi:hypothetical protein
VLTWAFGGGSGSDGLAVVSAHVDARSDLSRDGGEQQDRFVLLVQLTLHEDHRLRFTHHAPCAVHGHGVHASVGSPVRLGVEVHARQRDRGRTHRRLPQRSRRGPARTQLPRLRRTSTIARTDRKRSSQRLSRPGLAWSPDDSEEQLTSLGAVSLWDPPCPEVHAAIASAQAAGIRVLMSTGDQPPPARAIVDPGRFAGGARRACARHGADAERCDVAVASTSGSGVRSDIRCAEVGVGRVCAGRSAGAASDRHGVRGGTGRDIELVGARGVFRATGDEQGREPPRFRSRPTESSVLRAGRQSASGTAPRPSPGDLTTLPVRQGPRSWQSWPAPCRS